MKKEASEKGKKSKFFRKCQLKASRCPLSPVQGSLTMFSSMGTFFRMCLLKQKEVVFWDTSKKKGVPKHHRCLGCKQGQASKRGRIVVLLGEEIGVEIDESMSL